MCRHGVALVGTNGVSGIVRRQSPPEEVWILVIDRSKTFETNAILSIPALLLIFDLNVSPPQTDYVFSRTMITDAEPQDIWPLLLQLPDIEPTEGRWTIIQNILGVPRPASANVKNH